MGYSLCWLAARGRTMDALLDGLALRTTGERESVPESPQVGATLPGGWCLVLSNRGVELLDDALLARLSSGCEVVTCFVEEHVMHSQASGWRDGRRVWWIEHQAEQGLEHLAREGALPSSVAPIEARLRAALAAAGERAADYLFDVPVELAKAETGFRHDEDIAGAAAEPFEVLAPSTPATPATPAKAKRASWFGRLLGRG